jgi:hypothetical protein
MKKLIGLHLITNRACLLVESCLCEGWQVYAIICAEVVRVMNHWVTTLQNVTFSEQVLEHNDTIGQKNYLMYNGTILNNDK